MKKIIIDTNFLLVPEKFKIDIFTQLNELLPGVKMFVMDKTKDELDKIISQGGKDGLAAKVGKQLLEKNNIPELKSDEADYVDDAIVNTCADDKDFIVATNDAGLKRRLKEIRTRIVELRQKNYLLFKENY